MKSVTTMSSGIDPDYRDAVLASGAGLGVDFLNLPTHEAVRRIRAAVPVNQAVFDPELDVEDLAIPGFGAEITARVYRPHSAAGKGVLVNFHGGGWILGSADMDDQRCRALAKMVDCNIVSVNYRLAPEYPFPIPLEDCYSSVLWVSENASIFGFDSSRMAVGGVSAGANLAAAAALLARDRRGPQLVFQYLMVPVTDADFSGESYRKFGEGYVTTGRAIAWYWDQYVPSLEMRRDYYAAPLRARDLSGLPSALVQTAECDPLCDEGEAYAARLATSGVQTICTRYEGVPHGFIAMGLNRRKAHLAMEEAASALRTWLAG